MTIPCFALSCGVCRCYETYGFCRTEPLSRENRLRVVHIFGDRFCKMSKTRGSGDSDHRFDTLFTAFAGRPWVSPSLVRGSVISATSSPECCFRDKMLVMLRFLCCVSFPW